MGPLEVMVLEHRRGEASEAVRQLEAAGHHVLRCHGPSGRPFPCRGILDVRACPLRRGADVCLAVRREGSLVPSALEDGVACAIRAGIPLVVQGPVEEDPYVDWVTVRAGRDVVTACEAAVDPAWQALIREVRSRVDPLIAWDGLSPDAYRWTLTIDGSMVTVTVSGPPLEASVRQAAKVGLLLAVGRLGRTVGDVDVVFEARPAETAAAADAAQPNR